MTKFEKLEQKIYDNNIILKEKNTIDVMSACIKIKGSFAIFFDPNKLQNNTIKYTAIAHEYYHCINNALYTFDDTQMTRKRREHKANYEMIKDLIPLNKFISLLQNNYQIYEIAEYFEVDEKLIKEAYRIYKSKKELILCERDYT